ncbi:hypothetical protein [Streptomyces echinatus]|uniref:hypothetical protein n=1 Tax=Streptomyces echinatus TaxID=67293 RepID=UPI00379AC14B
MGASVVAVMVLFTGHGSGPIVPCHGVRRGKDSFLRRCRYMGRASFGNFVPRLDGGIGRLSDA